MIIIKITAHIKMDRKMELFTYNSDNQSVNSFLNDLDRVDLDPPYQRDFVWNNTQRSLYINSVIKGVANNNITFNKITVKVKNDDIVPRRICIDGKQRCNSLIMFKQNKAYVTLDNCDDDTDDAPKKYYYGPNKKDIPDGCSVLDDEYRCRFLDDKLHFITYQDLTYEQEIEIFNRIQHGKKLSPGELILSKMKSIDTCSHLKKFCETHELKLQHYCNVERKMGHQFIANLMFIIEHDNSKAVSKNSVDRFLNKISKPQLDILLKKVAKILDKTFTSNLLNSPKILKSKLLINEVLCYCYIIHRDILMAGKRISKESPKILLAISETHKSISGAQKTKKSMIDIINKFHELYTAEFHDPKSSSEYVSDS